MAIKNSKVSVPPLPPDRITGEEHGLTDLYHAIRDLDCLDGAEWHGYGAKLPRGGRMRSDMVRLVPMVPCVRALD